MKNILVIGAGKSSSTLIKYLIENSETEQWNIIVVDRILSQVIEKTQGHKNTEALEVDIMDEVQRRLLIKKADLVISMLPARFHLSTIIDCIALKTNIITPSYETPEIKELDAEARKNGVLVMNELGLDPGIDHMSAMRILNSIRRKG